MGRTHETFSCHPMLMLKTSVTEHRIQWLLFTTAFIAFAYFHQGGGWNQNVRFAMVRAIVEEGRL